MKRLSLCLVAVVTVVSFGVDTSLGQRIPARSLPAVDAKEAARLVVAETPIHTAASDSLVGAIMDQVNLDSLVSFVRILSGEDSVVVGGTKVLIRYRGSTGGNAAAEYVKQKLASYNLQIFDQTYSSSGRNIFAKQIGSPFPDTHYIVCAHYDAVEEYCADDNASGVAAVLEIARILSRYDISSTVVYALWDEEEQGLVGSGYYASQALASQMQIEGVFNLDMIGWDGNGDSVFDIHSSSTANSSDLASLLVSVNSMYGLSLKPSIYSPGTGASDHAVFWSRGWGAILLIEAYYGGDLNPYYHGSNDRISRFNLSFFRRMTQLSIGALSTLLQATAVGVELAGQEPLAFGLAQNYPNPFNPTTTIVYDLPVSGHVTLAVYDLLGREVAVLVDGIQEAGYRSVGFNASNLSSGVYLYRLTAGQYVATKKLILLK